MAAQLLEIEPRELKFLFELKKQSSCSIRLLNKTEYHVAFKVKTTSPKKYCVRPNVGIIAPNSTCEFTVTMQAQRSAPEDMICKDKFLIQSAVVPADTTDEDIKPSMFSRDEGNYVQENKLRVTLVSPPHSPMLMPINGTSLKPSPLDIPAAKDQTFSKIDFLNPEFKVAQADTHTIMGEEKLSPEKDKKIMSAEKINLEAEVLTRMVNDVKEVKSNTKADVQSNTKADVEGANLVKDIEEMKFKLSKLELKLSEADITISKLTEERRLSTQERQILREELALLRSRKDLKRVQVGFPLLFVVMVAMVSIAVGYLSHS